MTRTGKLHVAFVSIGISLFLLLALSEPAAAQSAPHYKLRLKPRPASAFHPGRSNLRAIARRFATFSPFQFQRLGVRKQSQDVRAPLSSNFSNIALPFGTTAKTERITSTKPFGLTPLRKALQENPDGSFTLDVTCTTANPCKVEAQLVFSKALFRNIFSLASPALGLPSCTVGSTTIPQCLFDTKNCTKVNGDFKCNNLYNESRDLGDFTTPPTFAGRLNVDVGRNDTIDFTWFANPSSNIPPDGFDHLRTSKIFPGAWLLEWEDQSGGGDRDFNDIVVLIRAVPPGFPLKAASLICEKDCPTLDLAYFTKLTVQEKGTPDRKLILDLIVRNYGPTARSVAVCPMLNIPSVTTPPNHYPFQHYIYRSGDGFPDCDSDGTEENVSIRFSNQPQTGAPACPWMPPAGSPDDTLVVPPNTPTGAGEAPIRYEVKIADVDAHLAPADRLNDLTSEEILGRVAQLTDHPGQLYVDVFYDVKYRPFFCASGIGTTFGEGRTGPAVGDVAKVTWSWNNLVTAAVGSPVQIFTELGNAEVMGPGGKDTQALLDILWEDNLVNHLKGHVDDPVLITSPGSPVIPVRQVFTLRGARINVAKINFRFPDDLPEGFAGKATVIVYEASSRRVIVSSILHFAKDHTPPALVGANTVRSPDRVNVEIMAKDAAAGIKGAIATPTVGGTTLLPVLLRYEEGDFTGDTRFTSDITGLAPADRIAVRTRVSDDFNNVHESGIPIAHADVDRVVECASPSGTPVALDGSRSTNDPAFPLTFTWTGPFGSVMGMNPTVTLPLGDHAISLTVSDSRGFKGTAAVRIKIVDTTPPTISCPKNFDAIAAKPGETKAVVTYPALNVMDNCSTPTVVCSPPSGSALPLGATAVTCKATDPSGNEASCNFTVTVWDVCIQDDASKDFILFNSFTGDYKFVRCGVGGFTMTGRGAITRVGCITRLEDDTRVISAEFDRCPIAPKNTGRASIKHPRIGTTFLIKDGNILNNTAACP